MTPNMDGQISHGSSFKKRSIPTSLSALSCPLIDSQVEESSESQKTVLLTSESREEKESREEYLREREPGYSIL